MLEESVYEIAILGRITWNLHSLNNEGTVGNVTEPRNISIINPKTGEVVVTDGISGEMLKHIHAEKIWELENDKNKFCDACKQFKPERADAIITTKMKPEDAINKMLACELCDIHGFLIQSIPVSRASTVEFGWALGIPQVERQIHTHSRVSVHVRELLEEEKEIGGWGEEKCSVEGCTTNPNESKLYKYKSKRAKEGKWYCEEHLPEEARRAIQMVYHRPTRSGVYAIVSVFQPWRIGLNNVTMDYVKNIDREERYRLVLKAYQSMFTKTEGAMTSTRLPHTTNFSGIIVVAKNNIPAPLISPLKENYIEEVKEISKTLEGIDVIEFSSVSEFVKGINDLVSKKPYSVRTK
jgi:CRISPR-associated protein Cst2